MQRYKPPLPSLPPGFRFGTDNFSPTSVSHLCVAHALRFGHLVGEVRLLEARGAHALVHGWVGAWRRVRRVEARLDQGLARLARDHGLEFARSKRVDVARFTGHQQQDLGARQGGQLVRLQGRAGEDERMSGSRKAIEVWSGAIIGPSFLGNAIFMYFDEEKKIINTSSKNTTAGDSDV